MFANIAIRHCSVGPEFCYNLTLFVGVMTMYTGGYFFVDTVYMYISCILASYSLFHCDLNPNL